MTGKKMTLKKIVEHAYIDIELTLETIVNANKPLYELSREKFPLVLSFKLMKSLRELDAKTVSFNTEKNAILAKYGTFDNEKKEYDFKGDNKEKVEKEIGQLLDRKIKVRIIPLDYQEFGDIKISPDVLANLTWLII